MSKYTTEVRYICETSAGLDESQGFNSINTILTNCIANVFDFDFPIFDENYRGVLERKILKHYYTREIATETVGLWKHFLDMRLNEIMPYYNKLYQSELLSFDPFYDIDITTTHQKDGTSVGNGNAKNTGTITDAGNNNSTRTDNLTKTSQDSGTQSDVVKNTRWDIYSDTPQGSLTNVENETYLTNARKITDDGTGSSTTFGKRVTLNDTGNQSVNETNSNTRTLNTTTNTTDNITTTEEYLQSVKGKTGGVSFSKMLNEYRDTFLNIDMMIIEELSDLFFGLW